MATLDDIRAQILADFGRLENLTQTAPEFQNVAGFYQQPAGSALMAQLAARASGQDAPFTPQVISSLIGQDVGAAARGVSNQSMLIRQQMANAGMSGSGLELSGLVNARRQASASARQARAQITSRAQLANYQARAQAQEQIQGYLQQQLQAQQFMATQKAQLARDAILGQNEFQARMREVSQAGLAQQQGQGQAQQTKQAWNPQTLGRKGPAGMQYHSPLTSAGLGMGGGIGGSPLTSGGMGPPSSGQRRMSYGGGAGGGLV